MDNGRCRMHGGATPKGIANPNFKNGRYSKYLPTSLTDRYKEAVSDPELLSLREEIGLVGTFTGELLSQLSDGANWGAMGAALDDVRDTWAALNDASRRGDAAAFTENLAALGSRINAARRLCTEGEAGADVFRQVGEQIDRRERLVRSESRRLEQMHHMIAVEDAMSLFVSLTQAVREAVDDRHVLTVISDEFARLAGRIGGGPSEILGEG
jgi:hypothetical protein